MTLGQWLSQQWETQREKLCVLRIDPTHVDLYQGRTPVQVVAGRHYFRLRLAEAFLASQAKAGTTLHQAVHVLVELNLGDRKVQLPMLVDGSRLTGDKPPAGDVLLRNIALTPTLPFNGGIVSLEAGLVALKGESRSAQYLQAMVNFSKVLAAPPVSVALKLAQPLSDGIQGLFSVSDSTLHLALREQFGSGEISEGYLATLRTPAGQIDPQRLWVVDNQLREGPSMAQSTPFERCDHMLFRFEVFEQRDDWDSLTTIIQPFQQAIEQLAGNEQQSQFLMRQALVQTMNSSDLTQAHRRVVAETLKERYRDAKEMMDVSFDLDEEISLDALMRSPGLSIEAALAQGAPTEEEIFELEL